MDSDSDGVLNVVDNCPTTFNPNQSDFNFDGIGDSCSDIDGDGVGDGDDNCPIINNAQQTDTDADGVGIRVTIAFSSSTHNSRILISKVQDV